jgi:hypothetical protein
MIQCKLEKRQQNTIIGGNALPKPFDLDTITLQFLTLYCYNLDIIISNIDTI